MNVSTETERELAAFCRRVLRDYPIPGLSLAVVTGEGEAYAQGFGARDLTGNRPASADTLYGIGSVTKGFTATAVLQLAAAGMCDPTDPIADHLDISLDHGPREYAAPDEPDGADQPDELDQPAESDKSGESGESGKSGEPIRIHHLLSHTSGLPSLGVSEALIARRVRRGEPGLPLSSRAELLAHLEDAVAAGEIAAAPGERFAYCNTGYVLLGHLIEELTGKTYAEYVSDHVLAPLGMERATFDDRAFARDDDHMTQYLIEDGELVAASLPHRELTLPTGGILSSVRELGNYLRCHLRDGDTTDFGADAGTGPLLASDRLQELYGEYGDTPAGPYGYGWRTREVCGHDLIGHAGSIAVSAAFAGFAPEEDVGIAVATNSSPGLSLAHVGEALFAILLGEEPDAAVPAFRRSRLFDRLTGEYAAFRGTRSATVTRDGGTLRLTYGGPLGGGTNPLQPEDLREGTHPDDLVPGDEVRFSTLSDGGDAEPVRFRFGERGAVRILVDRWNLRKVAEVPPSVDVPDDGDG